MPDLNEKRDLRLHFWGWILFSICALLFIAASIKNGDVLSLAASLIFLVACGVFMVPLLKKGNRNKS